MLFLVLLSSPVIYVLGSGPALWSRTQISNKQWHRAVTYYVAPLMWLNYRFRRRSLIEKVGMVDLSRSDNLQWYDSLESYWACFGSGTIREADRITLMLKFKLHGTRPNYLRI